MISIASPDDERNASGQKQSIDLSNATTFPAAAGYEINGRSGNDTLIGSNFAAGDFISGGTGADTMTGGDGSDYFRFDQGDSPLVSFADIGTAGLNTNDTFTFAVGLADRITDFSSGEGLELNSLFGDYTGVPGPGWMGATLPTNGLATDQGFFLVQGNYNGTTTFNVNSTVTGTDTLLVYDGDSTALVTQTAIVLSGVTLSELNAYAGSNWISHV